MRVARANPRNPSAMILKMIFNFNFKDICLSAPRQSATAQPSVIRITRSNCPVERLEAGLLIGSGNGEVPLGGRRDTTTLHLWLLVARQCTSRQSVFTAPSKTVRIPSPVPPDSQRQGGVLESRGFDKNVVVPLQWRPQIGDRPNQSRHIQQGSVIRPVRRYYQRPRGQLSPPRACLTFTRTR